jgi:hypothetical protein
MGRIAIMRSCSGSPCPRATARTDADIPARSKSMKVEKPVSLLVSASAIS